MRTPSKSPSRPTTAQARVLDRRRIAPPAAVSALTLLALGLAAALLILGTAGCDRSPTAPGGDVTLSFQTVVKTTRSNAFGPRILRPVRNDAEFAAVWSELWGDQEPARPDIDFGREMVVVATAKDSCFGDVTIERLEIAGGTLEIALAEPSSGILCLCIVPDFTFHVVRAVRVDLPERFSSRTVPSACGG